MGMKDTHGLRSTLTRLARAWLGDKNRRLFALAAVVVIETAAMLFLASGRPASALTRVYQMTPASVTVTPDNVTAAAGQTRAFAATVRNSMGMELPSASVNWSVGI